MEGFVSKATNSLPKSHDELEDNSITTQFWATKIFSPKLRLLYDYDT
jgi:hypothetical protein